MSSNSGTLWIVATPLGNPGDLSPRARETLEAAEQAWVDQVCAEVAANKQLLSDLLHALLPAAQYRAAPGTYLAWVDCTELGLGNPARHFEQVGRVAFSPGANFSQAHDQWVRVNLATSPQILTQAVERMAVSLRA